MPILTVGFALTLALLSGFFQMVPTFTRPDLFFAVTVAPEFRRTPEASQILKRFRLIVSLSTIFAIAVGVVRPLEAILLQAAGMLVALVHAHRRSLAFAAAPNPVIEVDLSAPQEGMPGGLLTALLPVLSVVGLGVWAGTHLDRMPSTIPIHWGFEGADRWVDTTPFTLIGFFVMHLSLCLLMVGLAWALLHWTRRIATTGPAAAGERRFRRRMAQMMIVNEYLLAMLPWFGLFQVSNTAMIAWVSVLSIIIVAFTVSLVRSGQGGTRVLAFSGGPPAGDRTPDDGWKWGLLYINPADPCILVEKRFGIGYTLNFGNRWTWLILGVLMVPLAAGMMILH